MQTKYVEKSLANLLNNHAKFTIVKYKVKTASTKLTMTTSVVHASLKSHKDLS